MPRIARLVVKGEPTVYHVISRTTLDGFVLGDIEKDYLLKLIKRLSSVYFSEVLGFCVMGNHFHLFVRMHPGEDYSDEDIRKRFTLWEGTRKDVEGWANTLFQGKMVEPFRIREGIQTNQTNFVLTTAIS